MGKDANQEERIIWTDMCDRCAQDFPSKKMKFIGELMLCWECYNEHLAEEQ